MIRYLHNAEIDRKKWDQCVSTSRQNMVYALSWYLDLVSPGWEGIVYEDYRAVMPLPVREKLGIKYMYQPFYAQQLGIYSRLFPDKELTGTFLSAIPADIRYIDYNLNHFHSNDLEGVKTTKRSNYELKLNSSYNKIEANFSANTRRNIQKAVLSIELANNVSVAEIVHLKKESQTVRWKPEFYVWLNVYMYRLIRMGKAEIIGVKHQDKLVAAAFILMCMGRIYYLVPASNPDGKRIRAMFAILDHIIGKYADTGLVLDFEGSSIEGIARFFAGFGAEEIPYLNIHINKLPFPLNYFKK